MVHHDTAARAKKDAVLLALTDKAHIVVDQISDMRAVRTEPIFDHHAFQVRMILAEFDEKPAGGRSLAILLGTPILHYDHFRAKWEYGQLVGTDNGCGEHLLVIFDFSISFDLFHAVRRADLCRGVDARTVESQQIMTVKPNKFLQGLVSLGIVEQSAERQAQRVGGDTIEGGAHLAIAGNNPNSENAMEALRFLTAPLVKCQQGLIFEGKHGKTTHQGINQRDLFVGGPMIGNLAKILSDGSEHCVLSVSLP